MVWHKKNICFYFTANIINVTVFYDFYEWYDMLNYFIIGIDIDIIM